MDKCKELYLSCDVETTHDVPGLGSMLSLGAVPIIWINGEWKTLETFYKKFQELEDGGWHPDVKAFWAKFPDKLAEAQADAEHPFHATWEFVRFCQKLQATYPDRSLVTVCNPAGYDFAFIRYYLSRFTGYDAPLGHRCLDIRSVVCERLRIPFKDAGKSNYLRSWTQDQFEHTHNALDDAREQAWQFARIADI